jgi:ankyrin repeat protein
LSGDQALLELSYVPEVGVDPRDHEGRTPLSWTMAGDEALGCPEGAALACLEWLLAKGARVSEPDYDGWTPLHHAAARGNLVALRRLLEAGANPTVLSQANESPASVAARLGQADAAAALRAFEKSP